MTDSLFPQSSKAAPPCTCRVTGPDYDQTRFDKACSYHGENGTMVARIGSHGPASQAPARIRERIQRKRDHSDGPDIPCAYCHGNGDICNPGNADPNVKVVDWLHPINCPRCGATGKEPNHG